jgi:hypothetical protein
LDAELYADHSKDGSEAEADFENLDQYLYHHTEDLDTEISHFC